MSDGAPRVRRAAAPFRRVEVLAATDVTPRLRRVTVGGPELDGLEVPPPASAVRLYVPTAEAAAARPLVLPTWDRNNFVLPDGTRPTLRTLTPRRVDPDRHTLDLEIVQHGDGRASSWAATAEPGDVAAISVHDRGWEPDPSADAVLLAGDETALPAIDQLLGLLTGGTWTGGPVRAIVETATDAARAALPDDAPVEWVDAAADRPPGSALVDAVKAVGVTPGTLVWAAGEAASVQAIRRHLFDERGIDRSDTWIRGYWKHGRRGT
ncbi:MAG: siderophore-interacting protein [Acidimicrobiales bacterium]|nr:siderophore-interacting protein [Acidimicrobiales bacterium]